MTAASKESSSIELVSFDHEVRAVEHQAQEPYELPELSLRLNIEKRGGDIHRIARHIHQTCAAHADHFRRANFVKLAYLGRFFITEAQAQNALGVTAAARCLLELNGFVRLVHGQLAREAAGPPTEWRARGSAFCDMVVRARYATSDSVKRAVLVENGVPEALCRPPKVTDCIAALEGRMPWTRAYYEILCDWVHANLTSQTVSTAGGRTASALFHESGGAMFLPQDTMINLHLYAPQVTIVPVLANFLPRARENFSDTLEAINTLAQTPFTREELLRLTGNEFGVEVLRPPRKRSLRAH